MRELNDFGGFNSKPPDPTWSFRLKRDRPGVKACNVDASAKHYVQARDVAAREISRLLGEDIAPQDVVGDLVVVPEP